MKIITFRLTKELGETGQNADKAGQAFNIAIPTAFQDLTLLPLLSTAPEPAPESEVHRHFPARYGVISLMKPSRRSLCQEHARGRILILDTTPTLFVRLQEPALGSPGVNHLWVCIASVFNQLAGLLS